MQLATCNFAMQGVRNQTFSQTVRLLNFTYVLIFGPNLNFTNVLIFGPTLNIHLLFITIVDFKHTNFFIRTTIISAHFNLLFQIFPTFYKNTHTLFHKYNLSI